MGPHPSFLNLRVAITGGTSGLGLALARELHLAGARVAFVARHRDRVDAVARELPGSSALGPVPLALLGDTECEDLERALATNVLGPFRLTKALLGALASSARNGRGALVLNISSDAAINAYPTWGQMISLGRDFVSVAWWLPTFPGLAILLTVLAINLVGDRLRDALDPRIG